MTAIARHSHPEVPDDDDTPPFGWRMEDADAPRPRRFPSAQRVGRRSEWAWIIASVLIALCLATAAVTGTVWLVVHLIHAV